MQKKSQSVQLSSNVGTSQKRGIEGFGRLSKQPEIYNMDTLGIISDDELNLIYQRLLNDHSVVLSKNGDTRMWEDEISYVQRELDMRNLRHIKHTEFVRQTERENARIEASLPYADLDNTRFLQLVGEI